MNDTLAELLKRSGLSYLYPYQELVIRRILESDYLKQVVLLPTGAGKSFCFLLPAQLFPRPTLVIYPLRALASDQYRRCSTAGLQAILLQGGQTRTQREEIWRKLKSGCIKVVMTNPETLSQLKVFKELTKQEFSHLVVDEAHCVSLWGRSFRPAYQKLGFWLKELHANRLTAFTATASLQVLDDLKDKLFHGATADLIQGNPDRPNIFYQTVGYLSFRLTLLEIVRKNPKPLLIFCRSRDRVRSLAQILWQEGYNARFYHAGMTSQEKKKVEEWFFSAQEGLLVSTNAYGMGVDKNNIRTVIHAENPPTTEDYLQESGRAGRDGQASKAILMKPLVYTPDPESSPCRRKELLKVLEYKASDCAGCDICWGIRGIPQELLHVSSVLNTHKDRLTEKEAITFLKGNKKDSELENLEGWGIWRDYDDLTTNELWQGLLNGGWISFHRRGWKKGLLRGPILH